MANTNDPLQDLLTDDAKAVDRSLLSSILKPFVMIDKNTRELQFTENFLKLDNNNVKLEVVLLAQKAKSLISDTEVTEGLNQSEVVSFDIMPVGSVKSTLKRLYDSKKIRKDSSGKYYIPSYLIPNISAKFNKEEK